MDPSATRRRFLGALGAAGVAALAGCSGGDGSADRDADDNETVEDADPSAAGDDDAETGDPSYPDPVDWTREERGTIAVGPDGVRAFDPDAVLVRPGTTVRWIWESGGHDLTPGALPDGADWDGVTATRSDGHEHELTPDVEGVYEYRCEAHAGSGMVGYVVVERE